MRNFSSEELNILTQLNQCDAEIVNLEVQLESLRITKINLEARILSVRSRNSPINRLPLELFLKVFKELRDEDQFYLGVILLVCRSWNNIVMNSSSLWSKISLNLKPNVRAIKRSTNFVKAAVRNSGIHPLHISITLPEYGDFANEMVTRVIRSGACEEYHWDNIALWLSEILDDTTNEPFSPHEEVSDHIIIYLNAVGGHNGVNVLRLRSLQLRYSATEFSQWISYHPFRFPTPFLETIFGTPGLLWDRSRKP